MTIKYRYIGGGGFFQGIPARDLTVDDWALLTPEQQSLVENSPHYQKVAAKKAAAAAEEIGKKEGE
jgi:hypothetical protein